MENPDIQLTLFPADKPVVHYFDANGALRTGRLLRRIRQGKRKGRLVVLGSNGRTCVPEKIRNIDYP